MLNEEDRKLRENEHFPGQSVSAPMQAGDEEHIPVDWCVIRYLGRTFMIGGKHFFEV